MKKYLFRCLECNHLYIGGLGKKCPNCASNNKKIISFFELIKDFIG